MKKILLAIWHWLVPPEQPTHKAGDVRLIDNSGKYLNVPVRKEKK